MAIYLLINDDKIYINMIGDTKRGSCEVTSCIRLTQQKQLKKYLELIFKFVRFLRVVNNDQQN